MNLLIAGLSLHSGINLQPAHWQVIDNILNIVLEPVLSQNFHRLQNVFQTSVSFMLLIDGRSPQDIFNYYFGRDFILAACIAGSSILLFDVPTLYLIHEAVVDPACLNMNFPGLLCAAHSSGEALHMPT
jgi:hypothetical protein